MREESVEFFSEGVRVAGILRLPDQGERGGANCQRGGQRQEAQPPPTFGKVTQSMTGEADRGEWEGGDHG